MNEVTAPAVGSYIQTYTGIRFDILNPTPEMITIDDIAHHLANCCRFTGAVKWHYSVAQHSYYASLIAGPQWRPRLALEALMHDASEAYICDMARPMKHFTECGKYYLPKIGR